MQYILLIRPGNVKNCQRTWNVEDITKVQRWHLGRGKSITGNLNGQSLPKYPNVNAAKDYEFS
ncbi:16415_t:CDS:2 [Funneliformis mosseae]|uniref:16415_t:CDS:1 n=1 Tax=Funneliformis mosseae TaxID=27381 RepID=A0A9N9GDZ1_FUNMO|nr:16415_t:CDS:2 [Funneliformis mosseae]